jgi:glycosyltransferase involved in cell wall biosynthesis
LEIVVNTRLLLKNKLEGIGRFSYETLKRITKQHPEDHFIFVFDRDFDEEFIFADNITPIILSPQARHPFLFYWWFEFSLPPILNRLKPDVFLSPDGYLSLRSNVPQLPVMHDLNFAHYPEDLPFLVRKYYNRFFPKFAQKAARIATVSEYSRKDIASTYGIDVQNIDVVYNGINEGFRPVADNIAKEIKEEFTDGKDYFLFVGSLHPRKNIARLMQAYDNYRKSSGSDKKLLIVGARYWWTTEIKNAYEGMQHMNDVIFTGHVTDDVLYKIMASAFALTYVPYFEGFGIPIVEAMQCGVPVITSNVTSMPEVAGDAAMLTDPFSVDSITQAMLALDKDEALRNKLVAKGKERCAQYSWDRSAALLWESIVKTVNK